MKKGSLVILYLLIVLPMLAQQATDVAIIPEPVSLEKRTGSFQFSGSTRIEAADRHPDVLRVANLFADQVRKATGYKATVQTTAAATRTNLVSFVLNKAEDMELGTEGYRLEVSPAAVTVKANYPAGLFYGIQTLLQLFPKEIESKTTVSQKSWAVPAVKVTDYPRFGWRGLMFDVSRHFFTKEQVKQFIDDMVKYKYNMLHLHLTDDQGWRIEIKSLPKLTSVGAWRVEKTGHFGGFSAPEADEPVNYGGFYTHEDIRELVKYAGERFVNILPEIDIPGHSMAAVAAYPELSCTPGNYRVSSGDKFMQWNGDGTFYALVDNTLCPANEQVYSFMDKVFTEVAELFPFGYIHMGGDECAKNFWEKSDAIKQLMEKEKLKDLHEVQSYFVKRIGKIIEAKGKKMMGWDEILEGGLAPGAAVMSWRGNKGGKEAAAAGHEVVMSPNNHVYIDLRQGDPAIEPPVYSQVLLKDSYKFEPVPDGVNPKLIKGGQANLWTEQVYNLRHQQYMTWPRAFAVAEAVWSPKDKKDWNNFIGRVEQHFKRYDVAEKKYAPSMYEPIINAAKTANGAIGVTFSQQLEGLDIYYSFDNSFPDRFYPKYSGSAVVVPKDAGFMKLVTYRGKEQVGRLITIPVTELKARADKKK
ncbi:beta-N-acetylhexosaminidase [Paraflavitalea sp. CAU 1676]|uniref:beta-N-acetylhexosaminidase n=1 Tax=Paraflavitalea sp. CAU 1676 TaxID=3032598 RepID=UPI0023DA0F41|nr:beta-N-acetylhexosaminidase [Paraflavitalea sp. CAU 1676]MDF2190225.1 beta-N-acetylhexosaminidase [Paraflavitalea sp. CAU 1676]